MGVRGEEPALFEVNRRNRLPLSIAAVTADLRGRKRLLINLCRFLVSNPL